MFTYTSSSTESSFGSFLLDISIPMAYNMYSVRFSQAFLPPHAGLLQVLCFVALSMCFCGSVFCIITRKKKNGIILPPGPPGWPILGNLVEIGRSGKPFMCVVKDLQKQYGSIFTLRMGQRTVIVVTSSKLAHEALIEKGHSFANRPPETPTRSLFSSNKCTVNSAEYGPLWRTLRRNLVSGMLSSSRVKEFKSVREWAVDRLLRRLQAEANANSGVVAVLPNCRFAVFCILLFMCFGILFDEEVIQRVDATLKEVLLTLEPRMDDFFPILRPFFGRQRRRVEAVRRLQMTQILPLVHQRRRQLAEGSSNTVAAYVDTLFSLELDEGGRKRLTDEELVTLCSEFLNGGTDTTATTLEWAMAHLVHDQTIQAKLYREIMDVVGSKKAVEEDDIDRMPFLNVVVKETLRMHPPTHFVLSHAVTDPSKLGGYDIPTKTTVEFYTAGMGNDPRLWSEPLEFRPRRFLEEEKDVDITGVREIKMMPFGAGRRICPGMGVGTRHINLTVARLVHAFQWLPDDPANASNMEEHYAFTVVRKNPLRSLIKPRTTSLN